MAHSFHFFLTTLNVSDLLMGCYLAVVGSADQVYRGVYFWHDAAWRSSAWCHVAGFLSLLPGGLLVRESVLLSLIPLAGVSEAEVSTQGGENIVVLSRSQSDTEGRKFYTSRG